MGPTSVSSSMATGCSGMRTATVPRVSPRSHWRDGWCLATRVSAPGQKASTSSQAISEKSVTRPCRVFGEPMRTGVGMLRPRPLASSRSADGLGGERVGADAVHGVGRQDHELAPADGGRGLAQTGRAVGRVVGVVSPCHLAGLLVHVLLRGLSSGACSSRQRPAGGREPRPVVEVRVVGRVGPAPLLGEDPRHLAALGVGVLDDDDTAGTQQPVGGAFQAPDECRGRPRPRTGRVRDRSRGPRVPRTPTR